MNEFIEKLIGSLEEKANQTWLVLTERNGYERAIEIVNQLADEYNNGWIPCSERLPETNQMVLATEKDSEYVILCCYEFFEGYGYGFNGSNGNVIAWMELPSAYRPKEK